MRPRCALREPRDGILRPMHKEGFRFAAYVALAMGALTLVMAWIYDLPVRDPDSVAGPTWLRLPGILLLAFLADVVPRALWRARNPLRAWPHVAAVVRERWHLAHVKFALVGLGTWYLTYASFRNLKSFVPFVNRHLWDGFLEDVDRILFLGHEPAEVMHAWFGTGFAAHFFSFVYVAWIAFVPASLALALVWSRNTRAGAWYVTAIAVDWVLGAATYFAVPTLGPIYSRPAMFEDLPRTDVTGLQEMMMSERHEVLVNPFTTQAVQTIAAFASLHVGICVTMCLMAELLRLHKALRVFLWVFLVLTVIATVYLGWHFAVDALGGVAARHGRRLDRGQGHGQLVPETLAARRGQLAGAGSPLLIRSAYAAASASSAYFVRGQKKPRSPSPFVRGTTCRCRCGTLWDTVLFMATNDPCASRRVRHDRGQPLPGLQERVAQRRRQVGQRHDVLARHQQDVALEHRPDVEEAHQLGLVEDDVSGCLPRDDRAEETPAVSWARETRPYAASGAAATG